MRDAWSKDYFRSRRTKREYVERIILVGVLEQSSCHAQHQTPEASSFAKAFFLWSIGKDLLWLTLPMESVVGLVSEGTCSSPLGWNLYKVSPRIKGTM
ncbi:hypothetical protein VULLAG_LOCUS13504 [Vulpes lagopus]